MRVKLTESGGFAPTFTSWELDTSTMSPSDAQELDRVVTASGICQLSGKRLPGASDVKMLRFEIEDAGSVSNTIFDQPSLPNGVQPLVAFLKNHADPIDRLEASSGEGQ